MRTFTTENEQETIKIAEQLSKYLTPGMTLLLQGDLGAGKTTFTKGIGAGLGVKRIIKSPTYTIIREYTDGKIPLYHIDLYRLSESEVPELGLEEYFDGDGVSVVEWPSVAPDDLPREHLAIKLANDLQNPEKRNITFEATGDEYEQVVEQLQKDLGNF